VKDGREEGGCALWRLSRVGNVTVQFLTCSRDETVECAEEAGGDGNAPRVSFCSLV
jgi:hypothetical protein